MIRARSLLRRRGHMPGSSRPYSAPQQFFGPHGFGIANDGHVEAWLVIGLLCHSPPQLDSAYTGFRCSLACTGPPGSS